MEMVELFWIDSTGFTGWTKSNVPETRATCHTIGFIVNETDEFITVAATYDNFTESYHSPLTIPKVAITKRWSVDLS